MRELFALSIAVAASVLINMAIYLQKKAVTHLPQVKLRLSFAVIKSFVTNGPWMLAQAANVSGFSLYVVALSLAPVSIVEPIIASGVVLVVYLAMKKLGEKPRRSDLFAMGMSVLGVVLLGISLLEGLPEDELRHPLEVWVVAATIFALAMIVPMLTRGGTVNQRSVGLGVSVGLLFGMGAVFTRLVTLNWRHSWELAAVFIVATIAAYLPGFIMLQAALQRGLATIVAPVYNGLMELVPIVMGMVVLNERLPSSIALSIARIAAFILIVAGAVILAQRMEGELEEDEKPEVDG